MKIYREAPFPHFVLPDFIDKHTLKAIHANWPHPKMIEIGTYQRKNSAEVLPLPLDSGWLDEVEAIVRKLLKRDDVFLDRALAGGGCHMMPAGGFLKSHVDFNLHPTEPWTRFANLIIFCNKYWNHEWNGALCFGKALDYEVPVVPGTAALFKTNETTWHGVKSVDCPESCERRTVALYFYRDGAEGERKTTVYVKAKK